MQRNHIVISGTGRAGTTLLIQLLTHLELDTGFSKNNMPISSNARAGLELDIRDEHAPYVVKDPRFCEYATEVLSRSDIKIDHVFIPVRNIHQAAASRRHVSETGLKKASLLKRITYRLGLSSMHGGLWNTRNGQQQEIILMNNLYQLLLALAGADIPVTLLQYPKLTKDAKYLYSKLVPVLKDIDFEMFQTVYNQIVKPDLVHTFDKI